MKWTACAGGSALALTIAIGALAFSTGLARVYAPPRMTDARLVGTWSDGHGGSVRLAADGEATAGQLHPDAEVVGTSLRLGKGCDGSGPWAFEPAKSTWDQGVTLTFAGHCGHATWQVLGTPDHPGIYEFTDDPDTGHIYALTKE
jgi:hypothetical protein